MTALELALAPQVHELKIEPWYMNDVLSGIKNFEFRINDRNYRIGDEVNLYECLNDTYTGRWYHLTISYILYGTGKYGLPDGYCIFSWM